MAKAGTTSSPFAGEREAREGEAGRARLSDLARLRNLSLQLLLLGCCAMPPAQCMGYACSQPQWMIGQTETGL